MARGKKQNVSAEEIMEQALVPEDEQPYEAPANWVWTRLGELTTVISKGTTPKGGKDSYTNDGVHFLRVENIDDNGDIDLNNIKYIDAETHQVFLKRSILAEGDILISIAGTLGRTSIVKKEHLPLNTNQAIAFIRLQDGRKTSNLYIEMALKSPTIQGLLLNQTKVTSIPNLTLEIIRNCVIPLPPYSEQHRIVDRVENLFVKLDQAKELAQNALDSFETRKAAILHKAFTGKLTEKWREEHGMGMDSWKTMPLSKLAYIQTGLAKGKQINSVTTTMPYLRVANVQDGYLDLSEIKQITVEKDKIERYLLKEGDVLFTEGGDYDKLGRGTVWRAEIDNCLHQNHVFAVRPEPTVLNSFYLAYLASSRYGKTYFLSCSKQTTNLASINSTQLKAFPVFCPSIIEQQEIVRILDTLIEKEQSAKYKLEPLLDKIDLMKKSILSRAFHGELGTNDPSEESALELLKEVVLPQ